MRTYFIYDISTDELLGEVEATSVLDAERKALRIYEDIESTNIAAFTERI